MIPQLFRSSARHRVVGLAILALTAACNPEGMGHGTAQPQTVPAPGPRISAEAGSIATDSAKLTHDTLAHAAHRADTTRTATGALHLRMVPGRSKQDSSSFYAAVRAGRRSTGWPVADVSTLPGAILPAKRIVAFYGNPLSKKMGILGQYPPDVMLAMLDTEVAAWHAADPNTPVQPALHLVAVVAQGAPGKDGMYRLRMDSAFIEKIYGWAQSRHALLFLDIQAGQSTVQAELPRLLPFLSRPDVELALDPEFYMHYSREGLRPGTKIGSMAASDVNYAIRTLDELATSKHLPPKILVVHRFTQRMLLNPEQIKPTPHVQVVMDMDGFGPPWLKFDSYRDYIVAAPVEYTGFKIFYQNDSKKGNPLLAPFEVLQLVPKPLYIQYQ